jgi:hypothetical protein
MGVGHNEARNSEWSGPEPTGTAYTTSTNPAAFGPPTSGNLGTSANGVVRDSGASVPDLGMAKHFALTEKARLRLLATATNALDHANYSNPDTTLTGVGQVGVIGAVGGVAGLDECGMRVLQGALRMEW